MKSLLRLILLITLLPAVAAAQPDMIVEHYTKESGLPSNTVYCAQKDGDGFVWFGTWHGLCSFDGTTFTPFITRTNHRSDMPPRKVRNIIGDKNGYLWIRNTDNHLYMFNKYDETYHDIYNELKKQSRNVQVIKIQAMDNGHIMLLTRNKDVFEAYVNEEKKIEVRKIFDSRRHIDPATMKLKTNILGENSRYVYWISRSLVLNIVTKKNSAPLLGRIKDRDITCFKKKKQYLCIGTARGILYIINTANGHTDQYAFRGMQSAVSSINIIDGKVYFTTKDGLYSFARGSAPRLITSQASGITQSFTDKYNKLWLCSGRGLLICHDPKTATSQTFTMPTDSLFAEMKFRDTGANGLFILMRNGEVWRYNHQTRMVQNINRQKDFSNYTSEPHFFDIDIDANGILWLSSTSSGVYKVCFPRYNFRFMFPQMLITDNDSDNNGIRAVYQARNGDLWIGTRKGELFCMDLKTRNIKRKFGSNEIGPVYHIMEDNKGNYWFSTKGAGLIKATPDAMAPQGLRITRYTNKRGDRNSLSSNRVYYTYQDSRGRIWVCTFYGGLNLIEERGGRIIFRNKRNGFRQYPRYELYTDVRSITEDRNGRMWVGTTDGLMSFDGKFSKPSDIKFETYRESHKSGITDNDIFTMYKDHKGYIWMGIFGSGLNKIEYYDEKNRQPVLKTYMINEKQGGDVISSIVEDKSHCLWICTENGLASMKQGSSYLKSYDRFAGFPEVNIEDNTSICLHNGTILIGSRQGLLSFDPEAVRNDNDARYPTFITNFKVVNRELWDFNPPIFEGSLKYADKIVLDHDQSTFTIEFSAPYYADNSLIPYTYILDGYEDEWHNSGTNRIASYANVPPGHYKFRVKVNDNNSPERVIEIIISPPWWATWWAYTIYTLLALLALYGALRLVMYMIKMRNEVYINDRLAELKIRFFTNVSHELRTPLSLIKGPIEELKNTEKLSPTGKEYISLIDRNARKMLQLVNQILDFRKIQNQKMKLLVEETDLISLLQKVMDSFRLIAKEKNIDYQMKSPIESVYGWVDRDKFEKIFFNLLSNAFKYTPEGKAITIKVLPHNETIDIEVADEGIGIAAEKQRTLFQRFETLVKQNILQPSSGIGLSLVKEMVEIHHGTIQVDSQPGIGSRFTVTLPLRKQVFEEDAQVEFILNDIQTASAPTDEETKRQEDTETKEEFDSNLSECHSILVVEDNKELRTFLKNSLSEHYTVITAANGKEGLQHAIDDLPDLIISDVMMPVMDGLEMVKQIKENSAICHIPIIILSAKASLDDRIAGLEQGIDDYITKPFSATYLKTRIITLLRQRKSLQEMYMAQLTDSKNACISSGLTPSQPQITPYDEKFMQKVMEFMETQMDNSELTIDAFAEHLMLSRTIFYRKLKSIIGLTPVDFIREIRIKRAVQLIDSGEYNFSQIAYMTGFSDPKYFSKCFKKVMGVTPTEYKEK